MVIAKVKERENIAEYILYMWQMEDLIRGYNMNLDEVMNHVFPGVETGDEYFEYKEWFASLIEEMLQNGLHRSGHIRSVKTYLKSLDSLHHSLLTVYQDSKYIETYKKAGPHIDELRRKSRTPETTPETELCFVGLYGLLVLKMSGQPISNETQAAMGDISQLMAHLSDSFNQLKEGKLKLPNQLNN